MDFSADYIRMCAAAEGLQAWWREPPVERENKGARPLHSNIEFGDFFHHGQPDDARPVQQVSLIVSKLVVVGANIKPRFEVAIGHDIGGHMRVQLHRQADDPLLLSGAHHSIIENGFAVWLPRFDQLARYLERSRGGLPLETWLHMIGGMALSHPGDSLERLALRVVMAEVFQLWRWDGGRREWRGE